ncbi:MAG: PEP-CTERM sorting domain-containing protein [Verrucomicrobiales bacterium]|jgi:hypothetical protein|nr:PEP-CTERM sorting domain-containing protein [Verrucomicrobiales bacterium]
MKTSKQIGKWLVMGVVVLASGTTAQAAYRTWTGTGGDNLWSNGANWDTGAWDNVDAARFGNINPGGSVAVNHDSAIASGTVYNIEFQAGSTAYNLGGSPITVSADTIVTNNSSVKQTISADFYSMYGSGGHTVNGGVAGLEFTGKFVNTSTNNWAYSFNSGTTFISQFYIANDDSGNGGTHNSGYQVGLTGNGTVVFNEIYDSTDSENTRAFGLGLYYGQKMILTGTSYTKGNIDIRYNSMIILQDNADLNAAANLSTETYQSVLINNSSVRLDKLTWKNGTLGGTGSILATKGALAAASGTYYIAPGDINSVGQLSFTGGDLVWNNGDSTVTYDWNFSDLAAAAGVGYDQVFADGSFDLGTGTQYVLNLIGLNGASLDDFADAAPGASWDIISVGSGITNFELDNWTATLPDDVVLTLSADHTKLQLMLIPEPSTWALLGAGVALLAFLRRRR